MMVLDYSERRPASKNRPRKQVGTVFMTVATVAITVAFGLGVMTGWYLFRAGDSCAVAKLTVASSGNRYVAPTMAQPGQPPRPDALVKPQDPALTFYETLSSGNKAVIGSGLNPRKILEPSPVKPLSPAASAVIPPAKPVFAAKLKVTEEPAEQSKEAAKALAEPPEIPPVTGKGGEKRGKFLLQVASCRDKKDAEAVRDRLTAGGIAAYLVESNIPDKGTWFRIRVGRHLDHQTAHDLAEKIGKGAIIIPE